MRTRAEADHTEGSAPTKPGATAMSIDKNIQTQPDGLLLELLEFGLSYDAG